MERSERIRGEGRSQRSASDNGARTMRSEDVGGNKTFRGATAEKAAVCGIARKKAAKNARAKKLGRPARVLLAGNPNCGKSTLYNALTGAHAKTGNWHGVTVGVSSRCAAIEGVRAEIFDLPGIYSLDAYSMEEKIARREIEEGEYDLVLCVADALTLPRSLALLESILRRRKRAVLVVTMYDLLLRRGGSLDQSALSERLGIPVLAVGAHSGRDIKTLKKFLAAALGGASGKRDTAGRSDRMSPSPKRESFSAERTIDCARATKSERIPGPAHSAESEKPAGYVRIVACARACGGVRQVLSGIYDAGAYRAGVLDKILYNKYLALPLFFAIMLAVFFIAFAEHMPGVLLKDACESFVAQTVGENLATLAARSGAEIAAEFLRSLFSSVGMLVSFVPQIAFLYLALFLMEESGYMSALAFMTDGLFRRVGLTGRAAFSVLMGFGCSAAAILTTRGLENKQLQKRVVFILAYISCGAKMPVYLAVASSFFARPFLAMTAVYFAGVLLAFGAALALKNVFKGGEEFVMEIAHPQIPSFRPVLKSLLFSVKQFIMKIATAVTAFLIVMWFALSFTFSFEYVGAGSEDSMMAVLCRGVRYLFYPMGITQWQVALAAVSGLIAKESVAGMLALFYGSDLTCAMSAPSAVAFLLFIMTCSPCVSAIAATARELGVGRALGFACVQTGLAFALAYVAYFLLCRGAAAAALLATLIPAVLLAAILFTRFKRNEKVRSSKKAKPQRFYR